MIDQTKKIKKNCDIFDTDVTGASWLAPHAKVRAAFFSIASPPPPDLENLVSGGETSDHCHRAK